MNRAVVLLSGGMDSTTTLYYAKKNGFNPYCLIFDYGQRHKKEILRAKRIARSCGSHFKVAKIALPKEGSALLRPSARIPSRSKIDKREIPATYVPARNIIFLSFAASVAETIGARAIFIGANAIDYSGYPDCRPEFIKAFQAMLNKGTKSGVKGQRIKIFAPLISKTKKDIVQLALKLRVPLELTWSCYQGGKRPCGVCDSCRLRQKGFAGAKIKDPALSL